ncbi:hypothetical protein N7495_000265 [Penicillium taxi]|uniref:uncharacterized protein n=1 Tax=Penicillium taxi TaxID=168475 RepID=UPI002545954D|nr:uncharacterized protein N7495_000265 [Penicillium taxi]KAJ5907583.1 hypothetical protein N7495_000265 [Penicillium taxi]
MDRPTSEFAQSGSHPPSIANANAASEPSADQTSTAPSSHYTNTPQPDPRPTPQYTPQPEVRQDYLPRLPPYAPASQPGAPAGMAQATSAKTEPFSPISLYSNHVVDSTLPATSPPYPPPYSPYQPQGHEMAYQGHQHPPHQMYGARGDWPHTYAPHHPLPNPYTPAATVSSASPVALAGFRPVYSFVPIPGAQQNKRPRRRYEEIERMYKCGWNGCEKAYGTLNHLNAHVTMQSHGAKRTPEEFKEIRKEWKARKKEEDTQRKAAEERERAAAQAAQANQVDASGPSDSQPGQPSAYGGGVRPQLPPLGYQAAESQVPSQYAPGGMVYQNYPPNYPHSPYQSGPVYQQRE